MKGIKTAVLTAIILFIGFGLLYWILSSVMGYIRGNNPTPPVVTNLPPVSVVTPAQVDSGTAVTVLVTHALSTPIDLGDKKAYPQGAQYLLSVLTTNHDMIVVYDGLTNNTSYLKANGFTWNAQGGVGNMVYGVCNRTIQFQLTTNSPAGTKLSIRVVPY